MKSLSELHKKAVTQAQNETDQNIQKIERVVVKK